MATEALLNQVKPNSQLGLYGHRDAHIKAVGGTSAWIQPQTNPSAGVPDLASIFHPWSPQRPQFYSNYQISGLPK